MGYPKSYLFKLNIKLIKTNIKPQPKIGSAECKGKNLSYRMILL
jgi:hypothetical protein